MTPPEISILLDLCEEPLFIVDGMGGRLRWCNDAAQALSGLSRDELLALEFLPMLSLEGGCEILSGGAYPLVNVFYDAEGREIPVEIRCRTIELDGGGSHIAVRLKPIGRDGDLVRVQHDIALAFNASRDPSEAFKEMLGRIIHTGGIDSGVIFLVDDDEKRLVLAAHRGLTGEFIAAIRSFPSDSMPYRLAMEGRAMYSFSGEFYAITDAVNEREGLHSIALIPVKHEGRVIAVLFFASHTHSIIAGKTRMTLESVGFQLGGIITRFQAEKALQESERRLRDVVEDQTELICRFSVDGTLSFVNEAYCRFFGATREELIGRNISDRISPGIWREIEEHLTSLTPRSPVRNYEHRIERSRRRTGWILWTCRAIFDVDGNLKEFQTVGHDVTDRKKIEERLRINEERLNLAMEATNDGLWDYDFHEGTMYSSPRNYSILDHDPSLKLDPQEYVLRRVVEEDKRRLTVLMRQYFLSGDESYEVEFRINLSSGGIRWILNRGKIVSREQDGRPRRIVGTCADITKRKVAEEKRFESEETLRSIVDNSPALIFIKNTEGQYTMFNNRMTAILGVPARGGIGRTDYDFFPTELADYFRSNDRRVIEEGNSIEVEDVIPLPEGDRTYLAIKFPLRDANGDIYAVGSILTDITERMAAMEELRRAKEQAEVANRAKSTFLASMSHEIRTPLHGIFGMTQLLASTEMESSQRDYVENIRVSCENLMTIIDDILDLSRIEADRLDLEISDFSLELLCRQVTALFSYQAEEKGVNLWVRRGYSTPEWLRGDMPRIRQVITNLVGNALKFTHRGYIDVLCDTVEREGELFLSVTVADTGPGIPPEYHESIFESFSQGDPATRREYGGTGLGLAIARGLVERMGGRISLRSEEGRGSVFAFTARCEKGSPQGEQPDAAITAKGPVGLSILVAEDNAINQRFLREVLQSAGHRVTVAGNGRQVLEAMEKETFDCILMDVQMPVMDGIETTRVIREREKSGGGHVPIIALTAAAFKGDREKFLAAGMDGYLSKPASMADLFAAIRAATGVAMASPPSSGTGPRKREGGLIERDSFLAMLDNTTRNTYLEIIELFLDEWKGRVERIRESVAKGEREPFIRDVHRLKGTVSVFYAMPLVALLDSMRTALDEDSQKLPRLVDELDADMERLAVELDQLKHEIENGT